MMGAPDHREWRRAHFQNRIAQRLRWQFYGWTFAIASWSFAAGVLFAELGGL